MSRGARKRTRNSTLAAGKLTDLLWRWGSGCDPSPCGQPNVIIVGFDQESLNACFEPTGKSRPLAHVSGSRILNDTDSIQDHILDAMQLAVSVEHTNGKQRCRLSFRPRASETDPCDILVGGSHGASSSFLGMQASLRKSRASKPSMRISAAAARSWEVFRCAVQHETLHALGVDHEHQHAWFLKEAGRDTDHPAKWDELVLMTLECGFDEATNESISRPLQVLCGGDEPRIRSLWWGLLCKRVIEVWRRFGFAVSCRLQDAILETYLESHCKLPKGESDAPAVKTAVTKLLAGFSAEQSVALTGLENVLDDIRNNAHRNYFEVVPVVTGEEVTGAARRTMSIDEKSIMLYCLLEIYFTPDSRGPNLNRFMNRINLCMSPGDCDFLVNLYPCAATALSELGARVRSRTAATSDTASAGSSADCRKPASESDNHAAGSDADEDASEAADGSGQASTEAGSTASSSESSAESDHADGHADDSSTDSVSVEVSTTKGSSRWSLWSDLALDAALAFLAVTGVAAALSPASVAGVVGFAVNPIGGLVLTGAACAFGYLTGRMKW
eukprot:c22045_g1_i1.p1 GENE.c22045_g1_i1~~c22045_g1_i1.p1  ORF type:complete len:559 (+),score=26.99 c22045_g1_i1:67-1743(+)